MAEYYPVPLAGQRITASLLTSMLPVVARKTADTSRSSTTTPTADPHLQFDVVASAVYVWDGWIKYFADPTVDMTVDWSTPSGTLGEWSMFVAGAGTTAASVNGYSIRTDSNDVNQSRVAYGTSDVALTMLVSGTVRVGSTAGTFSLDWAQAVSSATAAVLYADSWLRLQRIA